MSEILFEIGLSNAVISAAIAVAATAIGKLFRKPQLAYFVWLLVLLKLLMPSFLSVPLPEKNGLFNSPKAPVVLSTSTTGAVPVVPAGTEIPIEAATPAFEWTSLVEYIPLVWGIGILIALAWSLFRIIRFDCLLRGSSDRVSGSVKKIVLEFGSKLGLKRLPKIYETSADITPLVWWVGGKVRIYVPTRIIENLEKEELQMVLAHELAHVRRRDYLVRWLEWSAAIIFWWNPVVWWAQRNLRACEEICCDSLVLSTIAPEPHHYASSLLSAVEEFAGPALRPPSMASEVNSGGYLVRRIHMILSGNNTQIVTKPVRVFLICLALLVLPLGFANAQQSTSEEIEKVREKLEAEVQAGAISKQEAMARMASIKAEMAYKQVEEKLNIAVAEGKISPEDAARKLEAYKKSFEEKSKRALQLSLAAEDLEKSVTEGRLSKAEAKARMLELKMQQVILMRENKLQAAAKKLQAAVSMNRISAEEAQIQLEAVRRQLESSNQERRIAAQVEKLEWALENGNISREDAEARRRELEKKHIELSMRSERMTAASKLKEMVRANKISQEEAEVKLRTVEKQLKEAQSALKLKLAAEKLQAEARAGRISEEDARLKLEKMGMEFARQQRRAEFKRSVAALKAAVESGRMTEDEAKRKIDELQKAIQETENN
ncbi:MAG: M48 family metalloprotease [Pyrinomonadaceae bacterium]|nr:M48 family metalloprotease [Pyrinomonadaceae bacterium]